MNAYSQGQISGMACPRRQNNLRRSDRIAAMKSQDVDHKPLRSLLDLPNESLCQVSTHLQTEQDISSFAQVNSQLYRLTIAQLYQINAQHSASSALLWAGTRGRISTAQRALKERLDIEQPKASTPSIEAALVLAAENNHKDMVRLLVESGARPNWGDYERRQNAMEVAAKAGHVRIVQLLLGLGANPGAGFRLKPYAIQVAAREGHTEIVRLLIDAGQSPDSCSGRPEGGSSTPLQEAAKTNNVE